jgi:predicted Zn-dependent protease
MSIRGIRRFVRRRLLPLLAAALFFGLIAPHVWAWNHLRLARQEVERSHNSAAALHLRKVFAVHPNDREALILAARVARRSGAWDEADATLDRYWRRYGDEDQLVFERLLGRAARGGDPDTLKILRDRIRKGGPDARLAREAIATGLLYRYRWFEAEKNLNAWLAESPDDTSALHLLGQLQEQRNQSSPALQTFRRIVELDPEHLDARLRMTTLLLSLRQGDEAAPHLDYLRSKLPTNPEVLVQWSKAQALLGRTAEARAGLDECLRLTPNYPAALAERGKLAMAEGNDAAAEVDIAASVRVDPGEIATRKMLALVLLRNGKRTEAAAEEERIKRLEADYEKITQLSQGPLQSRPNDPSVPHEIGTIALRAGQASDALRWFQAALQIDPNYLPTHQQLAGLYQDLGSPALAARHRALAQKLALKP